MVPVKHLLTGLTCQSARVWLSLPVQPTGPSLQPLLSVPLFPTSFPSFSTLLDWNQRLGPGKNLFHPIQL